MDKLQAGNVKVTLVAKTPEISDKMKVTKKLNLRFSHSLPQKLIKLVSNTSMNGVEGFKDAIPTILEKCKNYKVYGKPGFKPVASVLLARVLRSCSSGFETFSVSHCNILD